MPDVVPTPDAGAGEAPPAPAPTAGGEVPGGAQTVPDAETAGVGPLLARMKARSAGANELEQVQRYYDSVEEARGLKTRVSEFESQTYKDRITADDLMADVDPDLHDEHKEWRETYTDRGYIEARRKQLKEVAAERLAETPDEELVRRIERIEKADKARGEKATQAERQKSFDSDLTEIVAGMKLSKEVSDFLRDNIHQSVPENIQNATQLADFAQKRLARITGLIASESKAAAPAPTPVTPDPPPPPSKDGDKAGYGDDGQPLSMAELVANASKKALGSTEAGAGAS